VSPVRYELGFYIPEEGIVVSHRHANFKPYKILHAYSFLFSTVRAVSIAGLVLFRVVIELHFYATNSETYEVPHYVIFILICKYSGKL
jgi:hypothetical protein